MNKKQIIAVIAIVVSSQTYAQSSNFDRSTCNDWIKNSKINEKNWLLGFVQGLNATGITDNKQNKIKSADQIYLWMDNYCKTNPLATVVEGANKLADELVKKK